MGVSTVSGDVRVVVEQDGARSASVASLPAQTPEDALDDYFMATARDSPIGADR